MVGAVGGGQIRLAQKHPNLWLFVSLTGGWEREENGMKQMKGVVGLRKNNVFCELVNICEVK